MEADKVTKNAAKRSGRRLKQLPVFRLGLLEDRNLRVGVFPQCEKVFVGGFGLGGVSRDHVPGEPVSENDHAGTIWTFVL